MGNNNTSGIIEEIAKNEAEEKGQELANSSHELEEENREDKINGLQGNGGPVGIEYAQSHPLENLKEGSTGFVNDDSKTQTNALPNGWSNVVEAINESILEEGSSGFGNNEINNNLSTNLEGEIQSNDIDSNAEPTLTTLNALPCEIIEAEEGESLPKKEIEETLGSDDSSCEIEPQSHMVGAEVMVDSNVNAMLDSVSDKDVGYFEKISKDDNLVLDDMDLDQEAPLDQMQEEEEKEAEECDDRILNAIDDTRNGVMSDERNVDSLDSLAGEIEKTDEFPTKDEERSISNDGDELGAETHPTFDVEVKPKESLVEMGLHDSLKINLEEEEVRDKVKEGLAATAEFPEENEETENKAIKHDIVTTESLLETTECELPQNDLSISNVVSEPNIPPHSTAEILQRPGIKPKPRDIGVQVVLKKSPSFDFGITPYDARSEESDQTPLLCHDRAATRSFSSCSADLRFQSRSVQTECTEKPLRYEAVEVEEKTIRMERSNSESLRPAGATFLNSSNNEENTNIVAKTTTETKYSADLTKGNREKKKARPSLFSTCICCTQAIS